MWFSESPVPRLNSTGLSSYETGFAYVKESIVWKKHWHILISNVFQSSIYTSTKRCPKTYLFYRYLRKKLLITMLLQQVGFSPE